MSKQTKKQKHSERDHAEFSPSGLEPISICPGYIERGGTNEAAIAGERIHEALEHDDPSALMNDNEVSYYQMCLKARDKIRFDHFKNNGHEEHREIRLVIPLDGGEETFGTLDMVMLNKDQSFGVAIDYKTGAWSVKEPCDNWQARAYTLGLFHRFPTLRTLSFYFLCPARDEILSGQFERSEVGVMRRIISKTIFHARKIRAKWVEDDPSKTDLNPNTYCQFCLNQHMCPALEGIAIQVARRYDPEAMIPEGSLHSSEVRDPEKLAAMYTVARIVEKWAGSVKTHVLQYVLDKENGGSIPGYQIRSLGAPRAVTNSEALRALALQFGLNDEQIKKAASYNLTTIRKLIKETAPKGKASRMEKQFLEEGEDAGVIRSGDTRWTLTTTRK